MKKSLILLSALALLVSYDLDAQIGKKLGGKNKQKTTAVESGENDQEISESEGKKKEKKKWYIESEGLYEKCESRVAIENVEEKC